MDLGLTGMMSSYSLGGIYPWNNLSYTGGLYPGNNLSIMNGLGYQSALSGVDFSTILNKAYNTEGKGYCVEFDENGKVSKITVKDAEEQAASSSEQKVQEVSGREKYKAETVETQEASRRFLEEKAVRRRLAMQERWQWDGYSGSWNIEKY